MCVAEAVVRLQVRADPREEVGPQGLQAEIDVCDDRKANIG